jgi:hypothetical protein
MNIVVGSVDVETGDTEDAELLEEDVGRKNRRMRRCFVRDDSLII